MLFFLVCFWRRLGNFMELIKSYAALHIQYSIFNRPIKSVHIISSSQIFISFHSKRSPTCRSIGLINSSIFQHSLIMMMIIASNSFDKPFSTESKRCDKVFRQKTKPNPSLNLNEKHVKQKKNNGNHGMITTIYT